jgi:hypothetical protein
MASLLLISLDFSNAAICKILTVLNLLLLGLAYSFTNSTRSRCVVSDYCLTASLIPHTHTSVVSDLTVALPEYFSAALSLLNLLNSLGRSKPATRLMQAH